MRRRKMALVKHVVVEIFFIRQEDLADMGVTFVKNVEIVALPPLGHVDVDK